MTLTAQRLDGIIRAVQSAIESIDLMLPIPLDVLPEDFPDHAPTPKFQIGDRVRWQPQPTEDFGTITGVQYAPAQHMQTWAWNTVWLDLQSPSRHWLTSDTAWETDLEPIPAIPLDRTLPEGQQP